MLLIDVSTSYYFRHWKAMGILRTEHEVIRAFRDGLPDQDVVFAVYNPSLHEYFRADPADLDGLLFDKSWQHPAPERALDALSRPRSFVRQLRFLRAIAQIERRFPETAQPDLKTYLARPLRDEETLAEMRRISIAEFMRTRRWLTFAMRFRPGLKPLIMRLDQANHLAHHRSFDAASSRLFTAERLVDPAMIKRYISVGGFWSDDRYEYAYKARSRFGWTLHYLIYDLIPVKWRHLTEPTTKETFPLSLHWVLWGVDQLWTISRTTRDDLLDHARDNGYPDPDPEWLKPVYLGSEIQTQLADADEQAAVLSRYDLTAGGFVLMVGTQEPRKNHDFAYRLWKELNLRAKATSPAGKVLPLVWVGQPGWSIGPLLDQVAQDHELPHKAIRILNDVDDKALDTLYRACRFTIYPSHYEGWGLPVVESLNYGKPCLASTAPAIVEAGQGYSQCIGLFDGETWIARATSLMQDEAAYATELDRVAGFVPCQWQDFRSALVADYLAFCSRDDRKPGSDRSEIAA